VGLLEAAESSDRRLVDRLTHLVNDVYRDAERGLWRDDAERTSATEIAGLIAARQIAVARRDGRIAGGVRVHDVGPDTAELGLLVSDPAQRGTGVGRALADHVEGHSRKRGLRAMRLELLLPRGWSHPEKEFLQTWYGRRGYRRIRTVEFDAGYPHLAPLLATPCDLAIYEKPLHDTGR
jgi:GNAT superfamily N-acetyltransferase